MKYILKTKCGQEICREVAEIEELRQIEIRDAMRGACTKDAAGEYIEIEEVYFTS